MTGEWPAPHGAPLVGGRSKRMGEAHRLVTAVSSRGACAFPSRTVESCPSRCRSSVELQEVVGQADQAPLLGDTIKPTAKELAETACLLDLTEYGLDDGLSSCVVFLALGRA